jgi:hypothetical protein
MQAGTAVIKRKKRAPLNESSTSPNIKRKTGVKTTNKTGERI